ncbi:MAG TPA: SGNH/GDSL hydrolase family protein, partial [Steroidobacteraceae bacterium]|nr:SGNH/GDSL hydrolase family protein [Steroidobacteraceae bacterium]
QASIRTLASVFTGVHPPVPAKRSFTCVTQRKSSRQLSEPRGWQTYSTFHSHRMPGLMRGHLVRSRFIRGVSIAALPALAIAAPAGTAPAGAASGVRYVALGDSYSAGLGAGGYEPSSGRCERSANAYPQDWAASNAPASFRSVACAGATTVDVRRRQLSALSARTTLVSITIGGNDAGFAGIMERCVLEPVHACVHAISSAQSFASRALSTRLDATLLAIHAHAPTARVVVLDYPEIYDISRSATCVGISTIKRRAIDRGADRLDRVIAAAAARNGDVFRDVRRYFSGHEICDPGSWLNSLTWPLADSYHPTASGQELGYLPAFRAAAG